MLLHARVARAHAGEPRLDQAVVLEEADEDGAEDPRGSGLRDRFLGPRLEGDHRAAHAARGVVFLLQPRANVLARVELGAQVGFELGEQLGQVFEEAGGVNHWRSAGGLTVSFSPAMDIQLTAVFRAVPEGYIAFVEELPGANTQGATLDEARRNLRDAVALVMEANRALAEQELGDADVIREPLRITA